MVQKLPATRLTIQNISSGVSDRVRSYHSNVLEEVIQHVQQKDIVVVGMAWNPFVQRAQKLLNAQKIPYTYLEYGSYVSQWKERLAIKMWSGWPTFPQIFVKGMLVGGFSDIQSLVQNDELKDLLNGDLDE